MMMTQVLVMMMMMVVSLGQSPGNGKRAYFETYHSSLNMYLTHKYSTNVHTPYVVETNIVTTTRVREISTQHRIIEHVSQIHISHLLTHFTSLNMHLTHKYTYLICLLTSHSLSIKNDQELAKRQWQVRIRLQEKRSYRNTFRWEFREMSAIMTFAFVLLVLEVTLNGSYNKEESTRWRARTTSL